jgi:hypothetical protein
MSDVASKDRLRDAFIVALYDETGGNPRARMDFRSIGSQIGLEDEQELEITARWLSDHGLAEWRGMGGIISITPLGVDVVEKARREEAFESPLPVLTTVERRTIEEILTKLSLADHRGELPLEGDARAEYEADRAAVDAEMRSPRPKRPVIGFLLRSIGTVLLGAAGSGLQVAVFEAAKSLLK